MSNTVNAIKPLPPREVLAQVWEERILPKLRKDPDGCWRYVTSTGKVRPYPQAKIKGEYYLVTRIALALAKDLNEESFCRHTCDKGSEGCCNPAHLEDGSMSDNALDASRRALRGVNVNKEVCPGCGADYWEDRVRFKESTGTLSPSRQCKDFCELVYGLIRKRVVNGGGSKEEAARLGNEAKERFRSSVKDGMDRIAAVETVVDSYAHLTQRSKPYIYRSKSPVKRKD